MQVKGFQGGQIQQVRQVREEEDKVVLPNSDLRGEIQDALREEEDNLVVRSQSSLVPRLISLVRSEGQDQPMPEG